MLFFNLLSVILQCDYLPNKNYRYTVSTDFSINSCYFTRTFAYSGRGGIFYCYNAKFNVLLNNCIFFECYSTSNGGAIYFYALKRYSTVEMNRICANSCFTTLNHGYQFAYIVNYQSMESYTKWNLISLTRCNNQVNGDTTFALRASDIVLNYLNSSYNINSHISAFEIVLPSKFTSSYCSIINNYVSTSRQIVLNGNNNNQLSFYNVVNNNNPSTTYGVISNWKDQYTISDSIFYNNINTLFYTHSGLLKIINCKIFHNSQYTTFEGTISTSNIIYQQTITFPISHLNTYKCLSIITTSTPIATRSNSLSPSKSLTLKPTISKTFSQTTQIKLINSKKKTQYKIDILYFTLNIFIF